MLSHPRRDAALPLDSTASEQATLTEPMQYVWVQPSSIGAVSALGSIAPGDETDAGRDQPRLEPGRGSRHEPARGGVTTSGTGGSARGGRILVA
jgi:hypothetical protein